MTTPAFRRGRAMTPSEQAEADAALAAVVGTPPEAMPDIPKTDAEFRDFWLEAANRGRRNALRFIAREGGT